MNLPSRRVSAHLALVVFGLLPCVGLQAAESIGLNFSVTENKETELEPADAAGYVEVEQSNWNNLPGVSGKAGTFKDSRGAAVAGMRTEWAVPTGDTAWRSKTGANWGFSGNNLKLQKGHIQLGGSLTVRGVPYAKYDVYVYINAGDNGGTGSVGIASPKGGVDKNAAYFYKLTWLDGVFTKSAATSEETATAANLVVFTGNTSREFTLNWTGNLKGGWSGVSAVQIVETP